MENHRGYGDPERVTPKSGADGSGGENGFAVSINGAVAAIDRGHGAMAGTDAVVFRLSDHVICNLSR